jgi:hypothetical protein
MATEIEFVCDWKTWKAGRKYKISDIGAGVSSELVSRGKAKYAIDKQISNSDTADSRADHATAGAQSMQSEPKLHRAR